MKKILILEVEVNFDMCDIYGYPYAQPANNKYGESIRISPDHFFDPNDVKYRLLKAGDIYFNQTCRRLMASFKDHTPPDKIRLVVKPAPKKKVITAKEELAEMLKNHHDLWTWLAQNPEKSKSECPIWKKVGRISHECFACKWLEGKFGKCRDGSKCPIDWPSKQGCVGDGGLFSLWCHAESGSDYRTSIANLIANLPLREGIKEVGNE